MAHDDVGIVALHIVFGQSDFSVAKSEGRLLVHPWEHQRPEGGDKGMVASEFIAVYTAEHRVGSLPQEWRIIDCTSEHFSDFSFR